MSDEYRFQRFKREFVIEDIDFQGGPRPDQPFPDFDLPTIDGGHVAKSDFVDRRPVLMIFSSFT